MLTFTRLICDNMFTGEWRIGEEKKTFKGNLDLAEFSFGELDDLQVIFSR